jgi:DNA gyrase/topoisomerase IV subunit A
MLKHFHLQKRGGVGIKAANCTAKTGNLVGMHIIYDDLGDVVLVSRNGQVIRMKLSTIKRLGRDTQGVTLMKLANDRVASVTIIRPEDKTEDKNDDKGSNEPPRKPSAPEKPGNKPDKKENASKPRVSKSSKEAEPPKIKINAYKEKPVAKTFTPKPETKTTKDPNSLPLKINSYNSKVKTEDGADERSDEKMPRKLFDEPNYWGKQ